MLKEIIASILIPAFLMQIFGCYSNSEITINNLEQHKKDNIKLITKDLKEYSLFYHSKSRERNWELADSVIYVTFKKLVPYSSGYLAEKVDTTIIPLSSVKGLYEHSLNVVGTAFIIGISIVIGFVTLFYISVWTNNGPFLFGK